MKHSPLVISENVVADIRRFAREGASVEALIGRMRADGVSKPVSMRLLADVTKLSLGQAKQAVHGSPVWADRQANDDVFQESVYRLAQELDAESPGAAVMRDGTHG